MKAWAPNFENIDKDARILVTGDAHGGFTRFLVDNGYVNIIVDEEILSLPPLYKEKITVDMNPLESLMLLTNPPTMWVTIQTITFSM